MSCKMLKKRRQVAALQSASRDVAWEVDGPVSFMDGQKEFVRRPQLMKAKRPGSFQSPAAVKRTLQIRIVSLVRRTRTGP
jgi:hypothetical protein